MKKAGHNDQPFHILVDVVCVLNEKQKREQHKQRN